MPPLVFVRSPPSIASPKIIVAEFSIWIVPLLLKAPSAPGSINESVSIANRPLFVAVALASVPPVNANSPLFSKVATSITVDSVEPFASCKKVPPPVSDPPNVTKELSVACSTPSMVVPDIVKTGSVGGAVSDTKTVVSAPTVSSVRSKSVRNSSVPPPVRVLLLLNTIVPASVVDSTPCRL